MQVGCACVVAVAEGLLVLPGLEAALGVAVAFAEGFTVFVAGPAVAVGAALAALLAPDVAVAVEVGAVAGGVSRSSQGGRLVPVPSCRSLMICSALLSVEAGTVDATNC